MTVACMCLFCILTLDVSQCLQSLLSEFRTLLIALMRPTRAVTFRQDVCDVLSSRHMCQLHITTVWGGDS